MENISLSRRKFLKDSSLGLAAVAISGGWTQNILAAEISGVGIVTDPGDSVAASAPSQWAISQLKQALEAKGVKVSLVNSVAAAAPTDLVIVAESQLHSIAGLPNAPEACALAEGQMNNRPVLLASANDARGMVYALMELTDRVLYTADIASALSVPAATIEQPHNQLRSIARNFVSEIEDKPWFVDKQYWQEYLTLLVTSRINCLSLNFGMGDNYGSPTKKINDAYLAFTYPFLISLKGVSVSDLSAGEQKTNLEMLKYISDECAKRALQFHLGLWTHSYEYVSTKFKVQGLSGGSGGVAHAEYCRDALRAVLEACPNITGMTFRVHRESGVPNGKYAFWKTLFSAVTPFVNAGRPLIIDMHAKECVQQQIDAATAAKATTIVSPKRWGEHQGLPYHQASIRPKEQSTDTDTTALNGQASRYGFANFMKEDRNFGIMHRIWPGTQRLLLWGDPLYAAGYGKTSSYCGSLGIEWCEPLSFKGRIGSGTTGGRCGYSDKSLNPKYDFQKFAYGYRLWGRLLYNPYANPEVWRRYLNTVFGAAAADVEAGLGNASRILLLTTTFHGASANCSYYWTEIYTNFNIVDGEPLHRDSDNPLRAASSFDPQLIMGIDDYVEALLSGKELITGQYNPIDFAAWVEDMANLAAEHIKKARSLMPPANPTEFRRFEIDVTILSGLGLFFAGKFRSAVLWSIYRKTGDANAKQQAVQYYEGARQAWLDLSAVGGVYVDDIGFGDLPMLKGHWKNRTGEITSDLNAMKAANHSAKTAITTHPGPAPQAIAAARGKPVRPVAGATHTPPKIFSAGKNLEISVNADGSTTAVTLFYRRVNQADKWQSVNMNKSGNNFTSSIPANYTQTNYPLQYYFAIIKDKTGTLYPGLDSTLDNQPYFTVSTLPGNTSIKSRVLDYDVVTLKNLRLKQNGSQLVLQYHLNRASKVTLSMFNAKGGLIATKRLTEITGGDKRTHWSMSARNVVTGQYFVTVTAEHSSLVKPIHIITQ